MENHIENISCPICSCNHYTRVLKTKDFRLKTSKDNFFIVACSQCRFKFLNPRPKEISIAKYYPDDFNKKGRAFYDQFLYYLFGLAQKNAIKTIFKKYKKEGRVLDIGCGNGTFLLSMQQNGYDVWGTELNACAKKYAPDTLQGRILYKKLEDCRFPEKSFDIITMFQSLEHFFNLKSILEEVRRILKDNGILYICVPNSDFFESRLFGKYCYNLEAPRHLYFFTRESLNSLLLKNGFQMKRMLAKSFSELMLTPLSFYYSTCYFLREKFGFFNKILEPLIFTPLVVLRFFVLFLFINSRQDLEVIYCLKKNEIH